MTVAAAGSVPSFPTSLSFWWQALEVESAGLRNREDTSALVLQCAVPSSLVGHSAASFHSSIQAGWGSAPHSPALRPASSWSAAISAFFSVFPDLGNTQSGGNVVKWPGPLSCSC